MVASSNKSQNIDKTCGKCSRLFNSKAKPTKCDFCEGFFHRSTCLSSHTATCSSDHSKARTTHSASSVQGAASYPLRTTTQSSISSQDSLINPISTMPSSTPPQSTSVSPPPASCNTATAPAQDHSSDRPLSRPLLSAPSQQSLDGTSNMMNRFAAHRKAMAAILFTGLAQKHRANPFIGLRLER